MAERNMLEERMSVSESCLLEQMRLQAELKDQLSEERKLRKFAERKAKTLQEQLDYAEQECFGIGL